MKRSRSLTTSITVEARTTTSSTARNASVAAAHGLSGASLTKRVASAFKGPQRPFTCSASLRVMGGKIAVITSWTPQAAGTQTPHFAMVGTASIWQ